MSEATRQSEIAKEQEHVDRVYARLETLRAEAERRHRAGFALADVRTPGSLVERDAMVYYTARRLRMLDSEYEGLVFGRLDLANGEVRYIGRMGLRDENHEPLVIDWRAPAAAPFYQATPEEPLGVVRRRLIRCVGGKVVDISDDLLDASADMPVVGEGALIAELARARGERMRDIVATIQREQDAAIRAPATGVTLIEGGPGTGKTAVALHRAAYLLYRDRRRFEGAGVLFVGPSATFMSYVDRVLPSLGEEAAELRALGEMVDGMRSDRFDPPALAALKGSSRMCRFLARAVRDEPPGAPTQLRIVYGGEVLRLREDDLAALRRELHARIRQPNAGGIEVRRALLAALWEARPEDVTWHPRRFAEEILSRDEFAQFVHAWWPIVAPAEVLGWLSDVERVRRAGAGWLDEQQCQALAESWAGAPGDLSVADVALVDELRALLGKPPAVRRPRSEEAVPSTVAERYYGAPQRQPWPENYDEYAHVVVDEAQDLSPMQWRMVGRRGQFASWTVVGDAAQSAWPIPGEAARARDEILRTKQSRRFLLTKNYRNSAEIFELAADVIRRFTPDADLPEAVRRTGVEPERRVVDAAALEAAVRDAVFGLLDVVEGTVGVITPAARAKAVADCLHGVPTRVQVVDSIRCKGMEYDGVVVVTPEEIMKESPMGGRVLYVALTRATQRLITVGTVEWVATLPQPAG